MLQRYLSRKTEFLSRISREAALTAELLEQYADLLDWKALSQNQNILWSEEALERHQDRIDFTRVVKGRLPWSVPFINSLINQQRCTWADLMKSPSLCKQPELFSYCLPHWNMFAKMNPVADKAGIGYGRGFDRLRFATWDIDDPKPYHDAVESCDAFFWKDFSRVDSFPWTLDFLEKHRDVLDWRALSWNDGLPWSLTLFEQFQNNIEWGRLTFNLPLSIELLKRFEEKWRWDYISWRIEDGDYLKSVMPRADLPPADLPGTLAKYFEDRLQWTELCFQDGYFDGLRGLYTSSYVQWGPEFFERLRPKIRQAILDERQHIEELDGEEDSFDWIEEIDSRNWSQDFAAYLLAHPVEGIRNAVTSAQLADMAGGCTEDFFRKHRDRFEVRDLLSKDWFPWSDYIEELEQDFEPYHWREFSGIALNVLTREQVEARKGRIAWNAASSVTVLNDELLEAYRDNWDYRELARNESLTLKQIERLQERFPSVAWRSLSQNLEVKNNAHLLDMSLPWVWEELLDVQEEYVPAFLRAVRDAD